MLEFLGGRNAIDRHYDSFDYDTILNFTAASTRPGTMFSAANSSLLQWAATENITYNDHSNGLSPATYAKNADLSASVTVRASSPLPPPAFASHQSRWCQQE